MDIINDADIEYIKRAIALSKQNLISNHGGPFGAVIIKDGRIIAESNNTVVKDNDPTAHAEINAIRKASHKLKSFNLEGCKIYTSCQPCPMCLSAIYWARIDAIYYANTKENAHDAGFDDNFIYNELMMPEKSRKIPMIKIAESSAIDVFNEWIKKEDKTHY